MALSCIGEGDLGEARQSQVEWFVKNGTNTWWLSCRVDRRYKAHIKVRHKDSAVRCFVSTRIDIHLERKTFPDIISLRTVDTFLTFAASLVEETASTSS